MRGYAIPAGVGVGLGLVFCLMFGVFRVHETTGKTRRVYYDVRCYSGGEVVAEWASVGRVRFQSNQTTIELLSGEVITDLPCVVTEDRP